MKFQKIIVAVVFTVTTISLGISCMGNSDSPVTEVEVAPEVSDVSDTGCQYYSRSAAPESQNPAIVLTKEGDNISCEVQNYSANCGVSYFDINQEYIKGKGHPDSLFIDLIPVIPAEMDCTCPYTVYFTIRNVKSDSFFLYCGDYMGMVSFKESNQVTIEIESELVTIDGWRYFIYKPGVQAALRNMGDYKGEFRVPTTLNYEGQEYYITTIGSTTFQGYEIPKIILPKTIRKMQVSGYTNFFIGCPDLEEIEVEAGSCLFSAVDGVLFSRDGKRLYCHPQANKRTSYTVPDGVEEIGKMAFFNNQNLTSIRIPESVTVIGSGAFQNCTNLESIYILGKLDREYVFEIRSLFSSIQATPTVYVPESEVEYIKYWYNGPVLPLP